jgi:hypothetical protein
VWRYQGREHTEAPVGLITEALLREIAGGPAAADSAPGYQVPENLRRFFAGKAARHSQGAEPCCSSTEQASCCEPAQKDACCGSSESGSCGCR